MKHRFLYLIIIGMCVLNSCQWQKRGGSALPMELVQAENIMYENPDSALHILQEMEMPMEAEAHATWALLLTQAKYKCFVEQSDSLVNVSYDYFMKRENVQRKALVLYHKAVLHKVKNQPDKALLYYLRASEEVVFTKDYRLAYLIFSHIGMIYAHRKLHEYSVSFCEKANEYALMSDDNYYVIESYNCLARAYSIQGENEKAVIFYDKAIEIGKTSKEEDLLTSSIHEKMVVYMNDKKYEEALETSKSLDLNRLSLAGYLTMGRLFKV